MTSPTPCVLSPTSSRIAGRRATQLARLSPERKKIAKIAFRQATSSRRGACGSACVALGNRGVVVSVHADITASSSKAGRSAGACE